MENAGQNAINEDKARKRAVRLFVMVLVFTAIAGGMSSKIFSNYFKEVYQVTSAQRGFIEIPRESPGILCMVLVAALGFMGNVRLAIVSQVLVLIGAVVMGFLSPSYGVMLAFLFIYSSGEHLFMPLNDSISMNLAKDGKVGTALGRFKGISTMVSMLATCMIFIGFRVGFFSFLTPVILPFAIAAVSTALAIVLLIRLSACMPEGGGTVSSHKLLFRREYLPYYMVTFAYGCQKRIKIVFAPWVIIELLRQGADVAALLSIAVSLAGIWVAPIIGKMLDRFGVRRMLLVEAGYILISFCAMGTLAGAVASGSFGVSGWQKWVIYGVYVLCVIFEQFAIVHAFLMRSIARDKSEVTQTLSVGLGVDHIMAIIASPIMGIIWEKAGVQYVFYLAAVSALLEVAASCMIAKRIKS